MPLNDTTDATPAPMMSVERAAEQRKSRKDPIFQRGPDWSLGKPYGRTPRHWLPKVKSLLELLVLCDLASYADASGLCYPKIKTIAQDIQSSERSVRRTISALEKRGFLRRTIRGGHLASAYKLLDFDE